MIFFFLVLGFQTGTKRPFDTPQYALKSLFGTSKSAEKTLFGLFDTSRRSAGSPSTCNANQGMSSFLLIVGSKIFQIKFSISTCHIIKLKLHFYNLFDIFFITLNKCNK